jgi:hypothetical protein
VTFAQNFQVFASVHLEHDHLLSLAVTYDACSTSEVARIGSARRTSSAQLTAPVGEAVAEPT